MSELQLTRKPVKHQALFTLKPPMIKLADGRDAINLCINNYLGLANHPALIATAMQGINQFQFGLSFPQFIHGTEALRRELELQLNAFLETEDTFLFSTCLTQHTDLFSQVMHHDDALISNIDNDFENLHHTQATTFNFENNNMTDLENQLRLATQFKNKFIATEGIFHMDGQIANLPAICDLAKKYNAHVLVNDTHAAGFVGEKRRGTPEYHHIADRVDLVMNQFVQTKNHFSGGYISGQKKWIDLLRAAEHPAQASQAEMINTTLSVLELLNASPERIQRLYQNSHYLREKLTALGFTLLPGDHPIIAVMLEDSAITAAMMQALLEEGIYVFAFSYPLVPQNKARLRLQVSAIHTQAHLDKTIAAFKKVGKNLGVIDL
ncbi:MAG: aminotransferase class I/II-fold pyridoxal phosphate-dependent enzyme [Gammaproteobacteria bacterium]|nr:aminotransferase class I/II-fold pyridoxal phosphate-dependent enzyme [Gammaproteobacteria bacterium]